VDVTGSWSAEGDAVTMHSQAVTIPKGNSSTTAKLTAGREQRAYCPSTAPPRFRFLRNRSSDS